MKKLLKITIVLVLLLALIVGAVAIFISPVAKRYIEQHDRELLGRSIRMQTLKINIFTGRLRLTQLRIGGAEDSTTFFRLDSLDVRFKLLPLLRNRVQVPYLTIAGPDVKIYQDGPKFNFDGILDHFASDSTQVDTLPSTPWDIAIGGIDIRRGHLLYKDLQLDATWGLNDVDLQIPGIYFSGQKTDVGAVLNFAQGGSLATRVGYDIETSEFDISLKLKDFTLAGTLPYIRQSLNVSSVQGLLGADVRLRGDVEHLLSMRVQGEASLSGFRMNDARQRTVLNLDTLGVRLTQGDMARMRFDFERIYVGGFSTFFELGPRGNNFDELMRPTTPAVAVAPPAPGVAEAEAVASPAPTLHIADLQVDRSSVTFRDLTLHRPFEYLISEIGLKCRDFSPSGRNDMRLEARMQRTGQARLRWQGSIEDINNQDITLALTNVSVKDFTPYCEHYTAYPLTNGNLTFRSQNLIRRRVLDGTNHLDLFEPKADKKRKELTPEFKIPLKLGLYILKDKKGHVKMDLPVQGSLDSPEFSYRKIVLKTIGNLLLKVVTAPFSFLTGHHDNLEYIDLDPQQYAFSSEQYASLDKIAAMLQDKPDLHIALTQRLNLSKALPHQALAALRMAYAEHLRAADSTAAATTTATTATAVATHATPALSLIEYEKIQQIDIRTPEVTAFVDTLLTRRSIPLHGLSTTDKALLLYRDQATGQLRTLAARRDKAVQEYMLTTHRLTQPHFTLHQSDSTATYTGRDRYTITLNLDGESVEITPADSTVTAPAAAVSVPATAAVPATAPVSVPAAVPAAAPSTPVSEPAPAPTPVSEPARAPVSASEPARAPVSASVRE